MKANVESVREVRSVALVTGGARRLGARLVRVLVGEGYAVAFSYHESADQAHALVDELGAGAEVAAFEADLRSPPECQALIESVEAEFGRIDLLVNNAGVLTKDDVDTTGVEDFDESIALNLRAPYLLSLECGRRMRERGEGVIVNIASVGGVKPYLKHLSYSLSKSGVVMLTRALASALAPCVAVNAIAPGALSLADDDESVEKPPLSSIPLGEYGMAADVEDALLYLCSTSYVTGQVICVDGGSSLGISLR